MQAIAKSLGKQLMAAGAREASTIAGGKKVSSLPPRVPDAWFGPTWQPHDVSVRSRCSGVAFFAQVVVVGAAGGIGQPLSLLMKMVRLCHGFFSVECARGSAPADPTRSGPAAEPPR